MDNNTITTTILGALLLIIPAVATWLVTWLKAKQDAIKAKKESDKQIQEIQEQRTVLQNEVALKENIVNLNGDLVHWITDAETQFTNGKEKKAFVMGKIYEHVKEGKIDFRHIAYYDNRVEVLLQDFNKFKNNEKEKS